MTPRHGAPRVLGLVAGTVYYAILVSWTWYFGAVAIVPLVLALASYWAAVGALVAWLGRRGVRSPWVTAAVWVLGEAAVARLPLHGFSWGEVGYALHDLAPARALASVGGVALVSFLAVATNGFLVDLVATTRARVAPPAAAATWRRGLLLALGGLLAVAMVLPTIATVTWMQPRVTGRFHVALIQGNDKNRDLTRTELDNRYLPAQPLRAGEPVARPL